MMLEFERDPTFRMDDVHDLTRPEVRERIMTRIPSMIKFIKNESVADFHKRLNILVLIDPGFLIRIGVHVSLKSKQKKTIVLPCVYVVRVVLEYHHESRDS